MRLVSSITRAINRLFRRRDRGEDAASRYNRAYFADLHQHERMLADRPRMDFYRALLARHVRPGDHVIDLGTGTGILAAIAARRGAACVHAIDHSPVLDHARALAQASGLTAIRFSSVHSRDFRLPGRVDVIVHEQMGNCLFEEGMIPNVCDLRDRLLKPGGRILPARFEFYCEPVQLAERHRIPFLHEIHDPDLDFSRAPRDEMPAPHHRRRRLDDPAAIEHFLSEPEPAFTFDLHTLAPNSPPPRLNWRRRVDRSARLDGYLVFFRALDDDLVLSTRPWDADRAHHWGFRLLRSEAREFSAGDHIDITLGADHWHRLDSWNWSEIRIPPTASPPSAHPHP